MGMTPSCAEVGFASRGYFNAMATMTVMTGVMRHIAVCCVNASYNLYLERIDTVTIHTGLQTKGNVLYDDNSFA